ncbi:Aste57867_755 [Aphanomyces stellatus]|uniref:aminodeoxychorismate synthase n=1 Tax=Aphanomyces stellatus TaxID=120398 RepID=A0A485K3D7_9STRA|nr:hypothetical protein As57867_000754 [Aphanomyces stellatus]VFT77979.1 Aste57867_755 [Aphanomyces stellatus]
MVAAVPPPRHRQLVQTLLLDNYDSYTYNLYQMLAQVNGLPPIVYFNDAFDGDWTALYTAFLGRVAHVQAVHADADIAINIVLSPGPGTPTKDSDFGLCKAAILDSPRDVPVLGVCLGHQGMAYLYGGRVDPAPQVMHGRTSRIQHVVTNDTCSLFAHVPTTFAVVRYHSLLATHLPPETLTILASTVDDNLVMAFRHRTLPHYGVQFHPESVCSEYGYQLLQNFRDLTLQAPCTTCRLHHEAFPSTVSPKPPQPDARSSNVPRLRTLAARVDVYPDPAVIFAAIYGASTHAFWLDSSNGMRFSFMGDTTGPLGQAITYDKWSDTVSVDHDTSHITLPDTGILDYLRAQLQHFAVADDDDDDAALMLPFDFRGGFVGYFGYEVLGVDAKSDLRQHPPADMKVPDASFVLTDRFVAFDHVKRTCYVVAVTTEDDQAAAASWLAGTTARLKHAPAAATSSQPDDMTTSSPVVFRPSRTRATYEANIAMILDKIDAGESYEVCLTNQLVAELHLGAPFEFYKTLRRLNPAPFAAFLRMPGYAVCCSSPERFISIDKHGAMESKPIKGTRKRCLDDLKTDATIAAELQACVKDRAENMMITDLVRNDFGHVCDVGSIHVPTLMHVESFATVHQLVTTVRGQLRRDCDVVDAIHATFPGGSMTGAPKKRTMEIIREVETHPRGVYSGALGYLSLNGAADLNIVIRTAVVTENHVTIGSGGAIVALSDTDDEYDEMLLKTKALRTAIGVYCDRPVHVDVEHAFYPNDAAARPVVG